MVLWGADRLTEGASGIARNMRMPEMVIGLTIVAAGTSAPELFVSLVSALRGTTDMAVGNVIGSNVFNTMLIVGCAAMVAPMVIAPSTVRKDIPATVIASALMVILCLDDFSSLSLNGKCISRIDGIILFAGFILFMAYTLKKAKQDSTARRLQRPFLRFAAPSPGNAGCGCSWVWAVSSLAVTSLWVRPRPWPPNSA